MPILQVRYSRKTLVASEVYHVITTANGRVERITDHWKGNGDSCEGNLKTPKHGTANTGPGNSKNTFDWLL